MNWPAGPWEIKKEGCFLIEGDTFEIKGSELVATGERVIPPDPQPRQETIPWGTNFTYLDDSHATVKSGDVVHTLTYEAKNPPQQPNNRLTCTYPAGSVHAQGRHPNTHTGGTGVSWTAEDGS